MNRRELLQQTAAFSLVGAIPFSFPGKKWTALEKTDSPNQTVPDQTAPI
jgi:hypothetical protein